MRYSIDRIEGGMVVLIDEQGREKVVDHFVFEEEPREGDRVVRQSGYFVRQEEETEKKKRENNALLRRLLLQKECFEKADRDDDAGGIDSI